MTRFKRDLAAKEIYEKSAGAWDEGYGSYGIVADGVYRFKEGKTLLEDDPRIDRPITAVTDQNIENVRMAIEENPHISIRCIAFELQLLYGTIGGVIHDELKLKK